MKENFKYYNKYKINLKFNTNIFKSKFSIITYITNYTRSSKLCFFIIILFILSINYSLCDIPVHCISNTIEGIWIIHMSNNNNDINIKCGHDHPDKNLDHLNFNYNDNDIFVEKFQTIVKLEKPNLVYSIKNINNLRSFKQNKSSDLIGTWTMIYDEGFAIKLIEYDFFAFSKYEKTGSFTPTNSDTEDTPGYNSLCNKTFLGWFKKTNSNSNWGCYWAEKILDIDELNKYNLELLDYNNLFKDLISSNTSSSNNYFNNKRRRIINIDNENKSTNNNKTNKDNFRLDNVDFAKVINNKISDYKKNDLIIYNQNSDIDKNFKNTNLSINTSIANTDNNVEALEINKKTSIINYTDFLKDLIQTSIYNKETTSKKHKADNYNKISNIPHLDIYFMNNDDNSINSTIDNNDNDSLNNKKSSNFLENSISVSFLNNNTKKKQIDVLKDRLFKPDYKYVETVNSSPNYKWKATIYPEFIGKSFSAMRSLLGSTLTSKNKKTSKSNNKLSSKLIDDNNQFIELDVEFENYNNSFSNNNAKAKLELPDSFMWTNVDGINYDSPIKRQGECGSCYAIAVVSAFESRVRIKTNNRLKPILSASSVIGCSRTNQGCSGGYPYLVGKHAFEMGLVEESCQGYNESDSICKNYCFEEKIYKASDYGYIGGYDGASNEINMMEEIYKNGPIVVAINATPELYYYKEGIFHSDAKKTEGNFEKNVRPWEYTNHAVVIIGWGEEVINNKPEKYWIVKNSWGEQWGENGYFKITKGVNMASIEAQSVYIMPDI